MRYAIIASVTRTVDDNYEVTTMTPTFFLDADVQGITNTEGALKVARRMFEDIGIPADKLHVSAAAVN
jgi:hypothetical protein